MKVVIFGHDVLPPHTFDIEIDLCVIASAATVQFTIKCWLYCINHFLLVGCVSDAITWTCLLVFVLVSSLQIEEESAHDYGGWKHSTY